jgi:phosphoenolpyruvate carboxykinase (ATP)
MTDPAALALVNPGTVHANLSAAALTELAVLRGEGVLAAKGALNVATGPYTGRSPRDRFLVSQPPSKSQIEWGPVNAPMERAVFDRLLDKAQAYLQRRELFVFDGWACADPKYRLPVRVVAERAWHALFARCLFLRPTAAERVGFVPQMTIVAAPGLRLEPAKDGTRSEIVIVLDLDRGLVLIVGTEYAGEMKKAVFTALNYLLPQKGVFPMHCSANVGAAGDVALFFGLSGTGKTTLSADPTRILIGDDEHGWSGEGVFNFEGGCYAKTIRLSREGEPQIWNAIRFGCVLENVVLDPETRRPNYDDESLTENTRAAYPVDFIDNCVPSGTGGHPRNVVFLTCDAFGVLPPLARLTPEQAQYHFLLGYTAKVAGTERGVTEPEATFSSCFAAPFLPLPATRYSEMLAEKLKKHNAPVWLVNTGWSGGGFGVGKRMSLAYTRTLVQAALGGELAGVSFVPDPVFGVAVPKQCPGVPAELLQPRATWKDPAEYDRQAQHLAGLFQKEFKQYAGRVSEAVRQAGPRV